MLLLNLLGFIIAALVMVKAAQYALKSISGIEKSLKLSGVIISFFLVGLVSAFPEGFVAIASVFQGVPSLGFGTLMGSVIADLSLVLGLVGIIAGRSKLSTGFQHEVWLLFLLMLPVILAADGTITRLDALILIGGCAMFFYNLLQKHNIMEKLSKGIKRDFAKYLGLFTIASSFVFISAIFVVKFAKNLAVELNIPPLILGLVFVALATSLPEFVFAVTAAKKKLPDIAMGELLGVVVIDATLLIGIMALIHPITVDAADLSRVGIFVMTSLALAVYFLRKDRIFTWKDGIVLIFIYLIFIISSLSTSNLFV